MRLRTYLALAVAVGLPGCMPRATIRADDYLPLDQGRTWTYLIHQGLDVTRLACERDGGDVRALDGQSSVKFAFVFATPEGFEHPTSKSIWALARGGPRLMFLDAWLWRLEFDPPIELLPADAKPGDTWAWDKSARLDREEIGPLNMTLHSPREIVTPAGTYQACVVQAACSTSGVRLQFWLAAGIGVLRVEITGDDTRPARSLELESYRVP